MFSICARVDSKKSDGNFGSNSTGIIVTAEHLELKTPEEIAAKADELFRLAREAIERQTGGDSVAKTPAPPAAPSNGNGSNGNGHPQGNGHPGNGNGSGRSYGRPQDAPSPKQRAFLAKLSRERHLGPESIREMAVRLTGKEPKAFTKQDMSRFIESLLAAEQAA